MTEAWKEWARPASGDTMQAWQDHRCAWCGFKTRLVRDHCHTTGLVRGMLCSSCNIAETFSHDGTWRGWREWDNPAHAFGWVEVYFGPGYTPLHDDSPLAYLSQDARRLWWDAQEVACERGEAWPVLPEVDVEARERERRNEAQVRAVFAGMYDPKNSA